MGSEDLSFWDRQMKFSAILEGLDDFRDRMDRESREWPSAELSRIAVGADPRQFFEWVGSGELGGIVPIFIHGGYWRMGEAEGQRIVCKGLQHFGPTVANIEYRLMPGTDLEGLITDVAAALSKVAEAMPANSGMLVLGHSAGAHLALAGTKAAGTADRTVLIAAVSGVFDLRPVLYSFVQPETGMTEEEVERFSFRCPADLPECPILSVVGGDETQEFQRQSEMLAGMIGSPVLRVPGTHHMTVLAPLSDPTSDAIAAIAAALPRTAQ